VKLNEVFPRRRILQQLSWAGLGLSLYQAGYVLGATKQKGKRMFHGQLKNWRNLIQAQPFKAAFEFLEKNDLPTMSLGRRDIEGDAVYALVQKASSRPPAEGKFEAHQKYIDIQYLVSGEEIIQVAPLDTLKMVTPYDDSKDIAFFSHPEKFQPITMHPDSFAVFFPEDGHMPLCHSGGPHELFKVVVKVKVDYWKAHQG
jgi:biofilm protein TabA